MSRTGKDCHGDETRKGTVKDLQLVFEGQP